MIKSGFEFFSVRKVLFLLLVLSLWYASAILYTNLLVHNIAMYHLSDIKSFLSISAWWYHFTFPNMVNIK